MNRRELVRAVAAHTSLDPKQVEATLVGVTDVITAVVSKGEAVTIPGFAKFTKISRPARMARNPQTGEPVQVKAKTVAKATAMKAFRDTVMNPSQAPKLARGVWPTDPEVLAQQANERRAATAAPRKAAASPVKAKKAPAKTARYKGCDRQASARQEVDGQASARQEVDGQAERSPLNERDGRRFGLPPQSAPPRLIATAFEEMPLPDRRSQRPCQQGRFLD